MDTGLVGRIGRVELAIDGGEVPGEALIGGAGVRESYIAYADEAIAADESVLVTEDLGDRRVRVVPWLDVDAR
ncbi:hypothetical protein [Tsukamurella soli]|uniref:Uncharacterized protein n=1 Tax=Tsukamurella soli TaxID=644556 RepID=A0ABP8JTK1_9ACTN